LKHSAQENVERFVHANLAKVLAAWIFLAYIFAHFQIYQADQNLLDSRLESLAVAHSIAYSGRFANPFYSMATGATAHLAPIYPGILGVILYFWGEGAAAVLAVKWLTILLVAAQAALFPTLSMRMRLGYLPGVLAAAAILVGDYQAYLWEANLTGVLILLSMFPMLSVMEGSPSSGTPFLLGLLWGTTMLVSPVPAPVFIAWLVYVALKGFLRFRQVAVLAIALTLTLLPWTIRNRVEIGHLVLVRDNLGLELAQFYCDCTKFSARLNTITNCSVGPNGVKKEAESVVALGEVDYNGKKLREAVAWIKQHPHAATILTLQRLGAFWFPTETGRLEDAIAGDVILWIATPLSIPGLWLIYRNNRIIGTNFLLWILLFPPIYYLIGQGRRSRYPILWVTLIPACFFLSSLLEGGIQSRKSE
jgi:hypothetical protein